MQISDTAFGTTDGSKIERVDVQFTCGVAQYPAS